MQEIVVADCGQPIHIAVFLPICRWQYFITNRASFFQVQRVSKQFLGEWHYLVENLHMGREVDDFNIWRSTDWDQNDIVLNMNTVFLNPQWFW